MPSSHLILCRSLLLLPPIPPSIRVFSNESALRIRWPKYWSFSFSISPSSEHPGLISFRRDWSDLLAVQGTLPSYPSLIFHPLPCVSHVAARMIILKLVQPWTLQGFLSASVNSRFLTKTYKVLLVTSASLQRNTILQCSPWLAFLPIFQAHSASGPLHLLFPLN